MSADMKPQDFTPPFRVCIDVLNGEKYMDCIKDSKGNSVCICDSGCYPPGEEMAHLIVDLLNKHYGVIK